jgi:hypothetical protein
VIALLTSNPNASVKVTVEISADFPDGATDQTKRAVSPWTEKLWIYDLRTNQKNRVKAW